MTGYPPGSLRDFQFVAESAYGTIPTGAMTWGGSTINYEPMINVNTQFLTLPGSAFYGSAIKGPFDVGCMLRWHDRAGSQWHDFIAAYGFGSASAQADTVPDFTLQADVYDGTTHNWHFHNGSKIQRADIIFPGVGKALEFEVDIVSQWLQIVSHASSKAISGQMQNVTPGADAAAETGAILTWAGNSQINIAGGGLATWYPTNMRLSVSRGMEREYGIKTGDDSTAYPVAIALHEGNADIQFTAEVISQNMTYANSKRNRQAITSLTIPVDDETITLANGEWDEPALPAYAQAINRERIAIKFKSLSIA